MKTQRTFIQLLTHKSNLALLTAAVVAAGAATPCSALEFDLIRIGAPSGATTSSARDINDVEEVAIEASYKIDRYTTATKSFVWRASSGFTSLSPLPGFTSSSPWTINNQGIVGGNSASSGNVRAVIWLPDGQSGYGAVDLNSLLPASSTWRLIGVGGIANDGKYISVIGSDFSNGYYGGVLLEMSSAPLAIISVTALGSLGPKTGDNSDSEPLAMNEFGQICGYASAGTIASAFFWDAATGMVNLTPNQDRSRANAINDFAQMVGQYIASSGYLRAALWQDGMHDLGTLGTGSSSRSTLLGINNDGIAVGWSDTGKQLSQQRAIIWDDQSGMRLLNPLVKNSTFVLTRATAINQNSQILAIAETSKKGGTESVLLTPR